MKGMWRGWIVRVGALMVLLGIFGLSDGGCASPPGPGDGSEQVADGRTDGTPDALTDQSTPPDVDWSTFQAPLPALEKPTTCQAADPSDLRTIPPCHRGSGDFGFWFNDVFGLPAYAYTLDQLNDKRAVYPHSWDNDRRDHMHQIGNDRVNGIAYNDGFVVLMAQDRGVTFYNRFDPDNGQYAGGFSIIGEGDNAFNTAYRWRPKEAKTRRVFGLGYYQTITQHRGLRITHTIYAPPGDVPALVDHVAIENLTQSPRDIRHYAYWDLNRHQAEFQPIRTGTWGPRGDQSRDQLNGKFNQKLQYEDGILQAEYAVKSDVTRPSRDTVSKTDLYPANVFMASLDAAPSEVYTDQKAFVGKGGISAPDAAKTPRKGEILKDQDALGQPAAMIMRHDLQLAPGETKTLRFAFGYLPNGKDMGLLAPLKAQKDKPRELLAGHWKPRLAYAASSDAPALSREVPWHAYSLLSATNYLEYYGTHVSPQGSAYLYLHGFDGAPRDQSLFSLGLSYLRPDLARANLKLIMGLTLGTDGRISYSFHGHGVREDAVVHKAPSDLDIFFLLALNEYLVATGDKAFLKEQVPFHPKTDSSLPKGAKGTTVLDHARAALVHLIEKVGVGDNGLIKVGTGDWSDGVVHESGQDAENSIAHGESIPNTQMAIYVLSRFAATIAADDPELAKQATDFVATLRKPVLDQFVGQWFLRAWLRNSNDEPVAIGKDTINLESQPWGILADLLTPAQSKGLMDIIYEQLDKGSPIGPTLWPKGMVWPAIAQLVTWAYTRTHPERAWDALKRQMFVAHAEAWPSLWFGIWSGADGFQSTNGEAWKSPVTPMTDWPVMNANQHGMFLLGLLRVAGVEPVDKGLRIRPLTHPADLAIDFPLLKLQRSKGQLSGEYRPHNDGKITLILAAPEGSSLSSVKVDGKDIPDAAGKESVEVPLTISKGSNIAFTLTWK